MVRFDEGFIILKLSNDLLSIYSRFDLEKKKIKSFLKRKSFLRVALEFDEIEILILSYTKMM